MNRHTHTHTRHYAQLVNIRTYIKSEDAVRLLTEAGPSRRLRGVLVEHEQTTKEVADCSNISTPTNMGSQDHKNSSSK